MTRVVFSGCEFDVVSASNIGDDSETMEFRKMDGSSDIVIAITQFGEYGSSDVSIIVFNEISLDVVEQAIDYARRCFGIPARDKK
ncbi:MAG: hypothetical protein ACRDSR_10315 [Pseudonocardiaceae bacterium]